MSSNSFETEKFSDELIADFIETGNFRGLKGVAGAIEYLTKKDLSALRNQSERSALSKDVRRVSRAESSIIDGFSFFVLSWGVNIVLTEHEKNHNIRPFIPDIAMLFRLRNRRNPEELHKLTILESKGDTREYSLRIDFWTGKDGKAFIKNIRIERIFEEEIQRSPEDASRYESPETFA